MMVARLEVQRIADDWTKVWKERTARQLFQRYLRNETIIVSFDQMLSALGSYESTITSLRNRAVAIAGAVHELIVARALESTGLKEGSGADFFRPTSDKQTQGDIVVSSKRRPAAQYRTEIKSLAARERFHVAIETLDGNRRVGLGFFDDPSEFNLSTASNLARIAEAIYLPPETLRQLSKPVRDLRNSRGRRLFRPISRYPRDMRAWALRGTDV